VTSLAPCKGVKNNELLLFAASAEQHSNHPVAKAVCHLAQKARVTLVAAEDIHEEAGRGIRGAIKGSSIFIGNLAWMEENGIKSSEFPDFTAERKSGMSLLFVLKDGKAFGWISLEDKPRPGAAECIQELKENGIQYTAIVSGDHNSVAARVAGELKVNNYFGECVPSDKISKVHQIKEMGHKTVFVGDGVNDAPALAASDISIAMGAAGSDVAIETATIALLNNELNRLPFLLQLAKGYRGVMFQNFALGALFITGGMIAGACGYLTAVPAAFLQAASAVVVVMNSARLIRSGEDLK
jgi:Cd2+/Zn2+-exporting ATPase